MSRIVKNFLLNYEQPASILIKNATVVTLGNNNEVLFNHDVGISSGVVSSLCENSLDEENYDKIIDGEGKLVLPGFINAHMHFYSSFARGLNLAEPAVDFPNILENLWWRLDKKLVQEDNYYSAMIALVGAIKHGTTTILDHHASPYCVTGSLETIGDGVLDAGLRASLCYEVSDRDGAEIREEGIAENVSWIKRCLEDDNELLKAHFGLHANFTIEDETMDICGSIGNELGVGFHIHTAEDISDQIITQNVMSGERKRVVERLNQFGMLGPKTICAHAVHLNQNEMELLQQTDTVVVHNPQSNMNNSVGVADLVELNNRTLVGLGTDAMTVNMMEELRTALWVHHLVKDASVGFMEVVEALVKNNALICERFWGDIGIGQLKEGGIADLCILDYASPTKFDESTFYGHLVFGISQERIDTTICNGKVLMENGKLTMIDEKKMMENALVFSNELWERF